MHAGLALVRRLPGQVSAQRRIGLRQGRKAQFQRPEIQAGSTNQQRYAALRMDPFDLQQGIRAKLGGGIGLGRVADVDEPVRETLQGRRIGLRRTDIHAAIDEGRVDTDQVERKMLGERAGKRGLARCRRPHQEEDARPAVSVIHARRPWLGCNRDGCR